MLVSEDGLNHQAALIQIITSTYIYRASVIVVYMDPGIVAFTGIDINRSIHLLIIKQIHNKPAHSRHSSKTSHVLSISCSIDNKENYR